MRTALLLTAAGCAMVAPLAAAASELIAYSYDARGRLIKVEHSGTVNDGVTTDYILDRADNRLGKTVTVAIAPAAASFSVNDATAAEGGALVFTVSRAGSTSAALTINYATSNGSALAGSDYTPASGTLSFAAGESSKTVSIATLDDISVEAAETLTLTLSGASGGATISDAQGTGTINDNDNAPVGVSFKINDPVATEGGSLVFTVTKTGSAGTTLSVNYATANGTASSSDYTAKSGTLTFLASETTKTISVPTTNNLLVEPEETVVVNLSAATSPATISDSQGVGTIVDDDGGGGCNPPPGQEPSC